MLRALTTAAAASTAPPSGSGPGAGRSSTTTPTTPPTTPPPGGSQGTTPPSAAPAADFALTVAPPSVTAMQGADAAYNLSIAGQNAFDGDVALTVSGLLAGATAAFAPSSVPASGSSTSL